jgi:VanZ family protein
MRPNTTPKLILRILVLTMVGIVYASLYPWDFQPRSAEVLRFLARRALTPPTSFGLRDLVVNVIVYIPLGLLLVLALRITFPLRFLITLFAGLVLSAAMEMGQMFVPQRIPSGLDVLTNVCGTIIGAALGALLEIHVLDRPVFNVRLMRLLTPRLARVMGWVMVLVLVYRELSPFHFSSSPQPFSWIPFAASMESERVAALEILGEKILLYGLTIWLFQRSGERTTLAGISIALLLGILEALQMYIPGRTPEISDPFLALLLTGVLSGRGYRGGTQVNL